MIKNKKRVTITVLFILTIGLIISLWNASTYALFSSDTYGANYDVYTTGNLLIVANSKSDKISLTNALPMSDEEGLQTNPYVFTIKNDGNLDYQFDVKLLATNSNTFSPNYIKLQIDDGEVKTLSQINSIIGDDLVLLAGESIDISIRAWLDENTPNTEIGKNFESNIAIDGQAIYTESDKNLVTPLSDFTYYLGSEYSTVDTLDYYDESNDQISQVSIPSVSLNSDEVLIVRYNGQSDNVLVPDTYTIDGITYDVIILSYTIDFSARYTFGTFYNNKNITSVVFSENVEFISSNEKNLAEYLFFDCTNLVSVPVMPSSIVSFRNTFSGCTNLTGTIRISSSDVIFFDDIFFGTSKPIRVEVPEGSTTHTSISALITSNGMPSNVTLAPY